MADKPIQIRSHLAVVRDHCRQFADFSFVYPVISRRAGGLSLGINLNPDKGCDFDCVYCEVDRREPGKVSRLVLEQLGDELMAMIRFVRDGGLAREPRFDELPWFITRNIKNLAFSGDGEPTLIHNFAECVEAVAEVKRREALDRTRIVLSTNAAGLNEPDVKRGLEIMDANQGEIWAKLDAGSEDYFRRINRTSVAFERILNNLRDSARVRPIILQSLFLRLDGEMLPPGELDAYCQRLNEIAQAGGRIQEVHAYTMARPASEVVAAKLTGAEVERFCGNDSDPNGIAVVAFD